ncbi:DISARM system SNF2-like helicase DrmD [Gordonia sp. HY442]|uniref:DISARM system SNF2-like helicase DrmD n=1 Tax=Gordonia zhenghanii TaxID=2911516 RepID=UPI001EFF758F|nr:DISARM system SNF2-like helicase DrmD [Gordonia zhenghanii]MCF8604009.1 DISARM system SNF2-like helicase DrmD [Gordonia zhenghanii]
MTVDVNPPTVVPEVGQVVSVRGSNWAVVDVQQQGLGRSTADDAVPQLQHAITLQSVQEDRLGHELRVVWELEQGRSALAHLGLPIEIDPDRFDNPNRLAAFIDALRWGAITSADDGTVQAPFRSGANVEPYQLTPLKRALASPRANLLLADDVGLGKTIEAGLVIQELLLRHRARTVLVVCPAGLAFKWQDEMQEKFGLDFTIVNSETMKDVRRSHGVHANPFTLFPRIIVSMAWLPGQRAQRLLRAAFTNTTQRFAFDILVVDEAHHVAPSSPVRTNKVGQERRGYAVDSQRTRAVREIAERSEHRLFLSATPHNGYTESFTALLEMIDPQRFVRGNKIDPVALGEVAVRRLKSDLKQAKGFVERKVSQLPYTPTAGESAAYDRLLAFTQRRDKAVATGDGSRSARDMATLLLKKRFFSSPVAFAQTVDVYRDTRTRGLDLEFDLDYDEIFGSDSDELEEGKLDQPEIEALREAKSSLPLLTEEDVEDLDWLSEWGHRFSGRPDSRLEALLSYVEGTLRSHGDWNNERLVIFTEYVDSLRWVRDILRQQGYEDDRVEIIDGGTDAETRELIRARFNENPAKTPVRILLATDAAGEGIDLQNHCHRLINFDIPFNPNRLEQRIGRVDRYGQTKAPDIRHFAPVAGGESALSKDVDLLSRVAVKIDQIMRDLGSANEIIAPDLQRQFGGEVIKSRRAQAEKDPIAGMMGGEKVLNAELARLEQNLAESRERLHLRPENLQRVVETAFELNHLPPLELVGSEDTDVPVFRLPNLDNSWEQVTRGLYTRLDEKKVKPRPISFDPQVLKEDPEVVYMHLGSPLLQRSTRRLRSALWGGDRALERVTATVVPGLEESYAVAVTRLVLVGRAGLRLHEEVFLAGTRLARRQAVGEHRAEELLESALDRADLVGVPPAIATQIAAAWNTERDDGLRARVQQAIGDRAARRRKDVEAHLVDRREADSARVGEIFDRFGQTLRDALREAEVMDGDPQLALFEDERRQSERDLREIRRRIDVLDEERDRELSAVTTRYDDIRTWEFPAAVIFALAPHDVENGLTIR